MAFVPESYVRELETRPDTVALAKGIHAVWCQLPDQHSVDTEAEPDWEKVSQYLKWKFLNAADSAIDAMQWGKIAVEMETLTSDQVKGNIPE